MDSLEVWEADDLLRVVQCLLLLPKLLNLSRRYAQYGEQSARHTRRDLFYDLRVFPFILGQSAKVKQNRFLTVKEDLVSLDGHSLHAFSFVWLLSIHLLVHHAQHLFGVAIVRDGINGERFAQLFTFKNRSSYELRPFQAFLLLR